MRFACVLKGGLLSIVPQELLLALQPSPPGLDHRTQPGIPAAAELTRGPGPGGAEHQEEHGGEGEARMGQTLLHYSDRCASLARLEEPTPDNQDKFLLWIHQSLWHETRARSLRCPATPTFSSFPILRQLLAH